MVGRRAAGGRTWGGADDLFIYRSADGADTIDDFVAGSATDDRIDLTRVAGIDTFSDVLAVASQVGADTVLDFGSGNSLTLLGVNAANLHQGDFIVS